jgi:hypothetical protein
MVWVQSRDKYIDGNGEILVRLYSTLPVTQTTGSHLDISSLIRYYSELPFFPWVLADPPFARWEERDDTTALLHVKHSDTTVTLSFHFASDSESLHISSPDRFREVKGEQVRTPWQAAFGDYIVAEGGIRVPARAQVSWFLQGRQFVYARFRVNRIGFFNTVVEHGLTGKNDSFLEDQ